ncbi:MAG: nuclear transport factor 2 family protein [Acidobacteriota bacterium]|nr:nuclear transport factor 2 family protein [Acidobacteriota bacterium]
MSITEMAQGLVDLCRQNKNIEAIEKYYSEDIVSVESVSGPAMPAEMKGLQAVKGKNQWWLDNHEVRSAQVNGPYIGEGQFAVEFVYDVTQKASGKEFHMNEMALYTVQGGKIVHEHFFYNAGG